jgi:hypothetical protein
VEIIKLKKSNKEFSSGNIMTEVTAMSQSYIPLIIFPKTDVCTP